MKSSRIAVILFNLGGPDQLSAVRPFLINLFSDPNIIRAPGIIRWLLARFIAWRRTGTAQEIYAKIGGGSPILPETLQQAEALENVLKNTGFSAIRCFTVMRYWTPRAAEIVQQVTDFAPDHVVLLPLYPQFSTTTTRSSLQEWRATAKQAGLTAEVHTICCYPEQPDFIAAHAALIQAQAASFIGPGSIGKARLLFSAHGLPQQIVNAGDPYPEQVARTAGAIAARLGLSAQDWEICYQSRVGPLKWLGPSTEDRLRAAGAAKQGVILVPIAFVSEHSETLVELDMEYRHLAEAAGVPYYLRIAALGVEKQFIQGLSQLVEDALAVSSYCSSTASSCPVDK
ncbi:MAG: ferrochelatase [Pseudomonadota bacterium]